MARVVSSLVLLCFALCLVEETRSKDLQLEDVLGWMDKLQEIQESVKQQTLMKMLYELPKSENGLVRQEDVDTELQGKNRRGLDGNKITIRRGGCKTFFWKTWTSC